MTTVVGMWITTWVGSIKSDEEEQQEDYHFTPPTDRRTTSAGIGGNFTLVDINSKMDFYRKA